MRIHTHLTIKLPQSNSSLALTRLPLICMQARSLRPQIFHHSTRTVQKLNKYVCCAQLGSTKSPACLNKKEKKIPLAYTVALTLILTDASKSSNRPKLVLPSIESSLVHEQCFGQSCCQNTCKLK